MIKLHQIYSLLACICLLLILNSCSKYQARRTNALQNIEMLRENVLLVRLKSEDKKIAALQKRNQQAAIVRTKNELLKQNTAIINAFKDNFKFCDLYFFYANEAKFLRNEEHDKLTLYNSKLQPVADNSFITKGYLIAALDYIHEIQFVGENETVRKAVSSTFGYPSLVLMDKDFVQLDKPFPRRVINRGGDLLDPEEVAMLDLNLFQYYKRSIRIKERKDSRVSKRNKDRRDLKE